MSRTIELVGVNGVTRILACDTAGPYDLRPDNGLWGMTSYELKGRRQINVDGESVDEVIAQPRTFAVPILVKGATQAAIDTAMADLAPLLNPDQGDCRIIVSRTLANGNTRQREIVARYVSGYEGIAIKRDSQRNAIVPLVFRAYYPWWRDIGAVERFHSEQFLDAIGAGVNVVAAVNEGDVRTWPKIGVWGAATSIQNVELANLTTGQTIRLVQVIEAGHVLSIDSDPATQSVLLDNFNIYSSTVDPFSDFWPLEPGLNWLMFRGLGANGFFSLRWEHRYNTC